ncbi:hypothetical protein ZPAH1_orf00337 [Aeromonas phage ZPAH1]|nr:hypothetical protein ASwh1_291 [Aeromonas phage Aswh_1]QQG34099.1 hypothetical protein ZPAH1_orf00337 [Aeromonas phage ZPAH1]
MKIKYISGDMIDMMKDPEWLKVPTIFVHGCNCHTAMNSGIAGGISKFFPEAPEADRLYQKLFKQKDGTVSMDMLGLYSWIPLEYGSKLVNLYTQYFPGPDLRLEALEEGFINIASDYGYDGYRLVFPKIGAGIAGGDWEVISKVIENTLDDDDFEEVICVEWDKR